MGRWRFVGATAYAVAAIAACATFDADSPPPGPDAGSDGSVAVVEAAAPVADGGGAGSDASVTASSCNGQLCASCAEILLALPAASSSVYQIRTKQTGVTVPVYCDMTTAGGGWTLVARSEQNGAASAAQDFGWHRSTGQLIGVDFAPYSLDVISTFVTAPTEVLFGSRGAGLAWGAQVYHANLPKTFFTEGVDASFDVYPLVRVIGGCDGGYFQRYAGWVGQPNVYFFRDNRENIGPFGLSADGWNVNQSKDCEHGGSLNEGAANSDGPGMIFVR